ncbi:MAG: Uma2 family endonuclease [Chloroflexi bacterium AL-W]|nr:Uma2 family endonuclease [Chloroflexi bacterium AL-N1]NOK71058.1 Uma2 family endonuclease [Chloroflexi bacterium AL-N10]NOK72720.1 Uma2 family endonuclease [Chloroflexi bacterium AL-N5]NOK79192.1 Uma2 family endonuclease [Chloroflexi bacterium AL-W]NOK87108.1 Uma2 family endonuclease [Chloroflexi bacterium AL-N15]
MVLDLPTHGFRIVAPDDETVLTLDALQGLWTEAQYLKMTDSNRRLVEFTDGMLAVLPMPTDRHQMICQFLFLAFLTFVQPFNGVVQFAPLRVQLRPGIFREPDLVLLCDAHNSRRQNQFWLGADLVVEVVSPDDPNRDTVQKRAEYAEAGIPEYWIVDPRTEQIIVLCLVEDTYQEHGVFSTDTTATSVLLEGFAITVADVFAPR